MRKSIKIGLKQLPFKKRKNVKAVKTRFLYGKSGVKSTKQTRIEGLYFKRFFLRIKKTFKKRKKQSRLKKIKVSFWARYSPNTVLTKKSKNARMGSGKGNYVRKCFTIPENKTLLEFRAAKKKWLIIIKRLALARWGINLVLCKK